MTPALTPPQHRSFSRRNFMTALGAASVGLTLTSRPLQAQTTEQSGLPLPPPPPTWLIAHDLDRHRTCLSR